MNNQTDVTEFIFLGFSNHPNLQGLFFLIFLVIYLTTLLGNTLIITSTRISSALHTPMYYFLSNLSFLDICYTSTTIPVMLMNFFREKKTISYDCCLSQVFFLVTCAGAECVLLAAMAYDRYVAICHPLQYPVLMSVKVCVFLVTGSWLCGLVNSVTHTVLAATLTLCGPNQISHFLCDIPFLLKLSCSDTSLNESVLHVASALIGLSPCLFTAVSYILIISAILRIPSVQGRSKAFSTCASHLTVVVVFYGTANFNYDRPREGYSLDMDILVSVLFCVMTPMLNPIIYSLRNKEVKCALRKLVAVEEIGASERLSGTPKATQVSRSEARESQLTSAPGPSIPHLASRHVKMLAPVAKCSSCKAPPTPGSRGAAHRHVSHCGHLLSMTVQMLSQSSSRNSQAPECNPTQEAPFHPV
ncbi:olfactory receptor 1052-like [Cervus canadensis]|uniref:olfactory receptor 1052-like n=1 Tax=Cervus canadensis TaxID=1574408 RepID=UPI001C9E66DC|nr:olfactory receptor 1052-like [Cervus canadensis]